MAARLRFKKLSSLFAAAIDDLRKVSRRKNVEINMSLWYDKSPVACTVCMAGAVLACRTNLITAGDSARTWDGLIGSVGLSTAYQMSAINHLREGDIKKACLKMGRRVPDGCPDYFHVPSYYQDRKAFYKAARNLVKLLKKHKL